MAKTGERLHVRLPTNCFVRYYLTAQGLVAATFRRIGDDERAAPHDNADAAKYLSVGQMRAWVSGEMFSAAQIGARSEYAGLYELVDWTEYVHDAAEGGRGERTGRQEWVISAKLNGEIAPPYNRATANTATKDVGASDFCRTRRNGIATIIAPYETSPLSDCAIITRAAAAWHNVPFRTVSADALDASRFHARMRIAGPVDLKADDVAEYCVQVLDPLSGAPVKAGDIDVHLEATAGYLSKRRVLARPGKDAVVKLRALDLVPGDTIKLKAGWRNYSGAAELIVQVV